MTRTKRPKQKKRKADYSAEFVPSPVLKRTRVKSEDGNEHFEYPRLKTEEKVGHNKYATSAKDENAKKYEHSRKTTEEIAAGHKDIVVLDGGRSEKKFAFIDLTADEDSKVDSLEEMSSVPYKAQTKVADGLTLISSKAIKHETEKAKKKKTKKRKAKKKKKSANKTVTPVNGRKRKTNNKTHGAWLMIENPIVNMPGATTLGWHSPSDYVSECAEHQMLPYLLLYGKDERGMMKRQPPKRWKFVLEQSEKCGMTLAQSLSLRRHHIMHMCQGRPNLEKLGLGREEDIRESAAIFENAVEQYLEKSGVAFYSEEEQKSNYYDNRQDGDLMPPTPDFLLKKRIDLSVTGAATEMHCDLNWIEAKMFYGASTIPHDGRGAVGNVLKTARKYVQCYGRGAMVFAFGCGDKLARELWDCGVIALDSAPVDLSQMEKHQMTWCANNAGVILP